MKKSARETFHEYPTSSLAHARTVMLDWNVSARLEAIHKAQLADEAISIGAEQGLRLRHLVEAIPSDAKLVTAVGAAEPELRPAATLMNVEKFNRRANIPAFYLDSWGDYLLHLLDGGKSELRELPPVTNEATDEAKGLHPWLVTAYAALLKAADIKRRSNGSAPERAEEYRFWLEHEFKGAPSREAWLGFVLLGGSPSHAQGVSHFLKLTRGGGSRPADIWGAAWDLSYTRLVGMVDHGQLKGSVAAPLCFVSDDNHLAEVMKSVSSVGAMAGVARSPFVADALDGTLLAPEVFDIFAAYAQRESKRVVERSKGLTRTLMNRAAYEALQLERHWDN
jgi:hypothetical protein